MLNTKSFLSINFGAGSLKVAEFDQTETGMLRLLQFGVKPLGLAGSQESARERVLGRALQELFTEGTWGSRNVNICAPGFHVFSKFVKLPPVDTSKVTQIIQYEAQQNVPFPLDEVVWDYQILGTTSGGELEILLVAIKTDIVEGLFRTCETPGLSVNLVDVSPASLCNAFRYNYEDLEGCTMLLDIGAKTSNVLFFEKGKVYARGINIGANSITQDFATESKLPFAEAEKFKISEGFVSLGGAYEEPENPRQAAISKIARQVMTRLHIQVNQTIQFYRGQQGGSQPQRLFLAGGASIMPYTAQFFAEKLNIEVDYFNPFRNVHIEPGVNLEELAGTAHAFGEVVGLGLRSVAQCPVELNLIPKNLLKRQQLNQKKPYFVATILSLVAVIFALGWFFDKVAAVTESALTKVDQQVQPLQSLEARLERHERAIEERTNQISQLSVWLENRFYWGDLLEEVRRVMMESEQRVSQWLGGVDTGIWVETFRPEIPGEEESMFTAGMEMEEEETEEGVGDPYAGMTPEMRERYGLGPATTTTTADSTVAEEPSTNEISTVTMTCRGVNLSRHRPDANSELAYILDEALKRSPVFEEEGTELKGEFESVDASEPTFSFEVTLKLKEPIKL